MRRKKMVLKILGAVFSGGTFLAAAIGVGYGIRQWGAARKQRKREFLSEYLKEYRSEDMGKSIAELWEFYRRNDCDTKKMSDSYFEEDKNDPTRRFHFAVRRRVSAFYQQMALLAANDKDIENILYQVWTEGDLRLVRNIILPLELEAVPRVIAKTTKNEGGMINTDDSWSPAFKAMARLYNRAYEREQKELSKKSKRK
jgi:hypothetical protein